MYQSLDLVFTLDFDRHHKATVPQRDDRLLQGLGILRRADNAVQLLTDLKLGTADTAAQVGKSRGGGIGELLLREYGVKNVLFQPLHRR